MNALQVDRSRWPQAQAQRHRAVLAVGEDGHHWLLADRPPDLLLLQAAEARLGLPLRWQQQAPAALDRWLAEGELDARALDSLPGSGAGASARDARDALDERDDQPRELTLAGLGPADGGAVQLLDALLFDALQERASDLHIEHQARGAEVRLRVDGVMRPLRQLGSSALAEQLVSRLKVMAELDIGERRLPQDGRFKLRAQGREVDFRLSIMPSVFGEDAVVRLLDRSALQGGPAGARRSPLTLAALGLPQALRSSLVQLARAPHGLLLVTGPTGSGKTTTLYAAMSEVHTGREKLITIEDPVEYQLPGAVQIPVNDKKGLGFARGLRAILRHDPDRVMVGEIRDAETAQIAVQAALTGHLVFSTVHANGVFDVIGRFMHMGLDLFNLVAALNAVLAQRLPRQVCPQCAAPHAASAAERALLDAPDGPPLQMRLGRGCAHCGGSGYCGRQSAQAELRTLRAAQQKTADELAQALTAVAAGQAALRDAEAHSAAQQQDHQQQIATLRLERDERSSANRALVARLEATTQALLEAQERNRQLHAVGQEAIQRLRGRTAVEGLLLKERVLGLAAVRLDSQAEELLMRLDAQRQPLAGAANP